MRQEFGSHELVACAGNKHAEGLGQNPNSSQSLCPARAGDQHAEGARRQGARGAEQVGPGGPAAAHARLRGAHVVAGQGLQKPRGAPALPKAFSNE